MSLEFWNLTFRARSDTFVQTNYRQMLVLYRTALDMLGARQDERVLDLYAGIGTLSVAVAREAAGVTAIEENPRAVQLGRLNAKINSARVEYLPGKVEAVLRQVRLGQHQAVILDPPRAGCEPAAIAELIRLGPQARGLRVLRALDPRSGPGQPGPRRVSRSPRGDRGHVPSDLPHRKRGAAGETVRLGAVEPLGELDDHEPEPPWAHRSDHGGIGSASGSAYRAKRNVELERLRPESTWAA